MIKERMRKSPLTPPLQSFNNSLDHQPVASLDSLPALETLSLERSLPLKARSPCVLFNLSFEVEAYVSVRQLWQAIQRGELGNLTGTFQKNFKDLCMEIRLDNTLLKE